MSPNSAAPQNAPTFLAQAEALVAALRMMQQMVNSARREAEREGNPFLMVDTDDAQAKLDVALSHADAFLRGVGEVEWRSIDSAPRDGVTWIRVGMPSSASPTGWWETVAVLYPEPDEEHWTDGAMLMHYNGNVTIAGFKGPLTHWQPLTGPYDNRRRGSDE